MARVMTVVVPKPEFDALVAENTRLREALREIATGEFDDLDPDDGLHQKSARALARRALGGDE